MSDTSAHAYVRSSISIQNFCLKNVCENNYYIPGWGWAGLRTALNAKDIVNLTDMGVSHIYILIIIQIPKSCAKKLDKSRIQNQSIINLPFSSIHLNMKISYIFIWYTHVCVMCAGNEVCLVGKIGFLLHQLDLEVVLVVSTWEEFN